jgi:trehalose-6-phosphate synthase
MHLLSYRGPGAPGGLSSALSATWNDHSRADRGWWYFADDSLRFSPGPHAPSLVAAMDREMLEGHYRFCNEFLWPLMHELPQYCTFNAGDLKHYKALQASVAQSMRRRSEPLFVHDYHFALMPNLIPNRTSLFWHIPWPKRVEPIWQPMIREMSVRMLNCEQIGFHTEDYAENFLRGLDPAVHVVAERKLVVAPIGVNSEVWHRRAADLSNPIPDEIAAIETPIVLSVDRADYAKGILERLHAIDAFFNEHAHYRDKVTFVQMCAPSRSGLSAYSSYWDTCVGSEHQWALGTRAMEAHCLDRKRLQSGSPGQDIRES